MAIQATVTSKGQVTIPVDYRRAYSIETGDIVLFEAEKEGMRIIKSEPIDILYLNSLQKTLEKEWGSEADNQAYNDL